MKTKTKEKDTTTKRVKRGFKVVVEKLKTGYNKVCNSNYVKNIQAENNNPKPESMFPAMPVELQVSKDKKNQFETDFSNIGKCDL